VSNPKNRILYEINKNAALDDIQDGVDSTISFNEGDLLYFDDTNNLVKPTTGGGTDGATFLGISRVTVVSGKLKSPYSGTAVDASEKAGRIPGPVCGVVAKMIGTTGDVMAYGDPVYVSATSPQHVQKTANGTLIGYFVGKPVTVAAGQEIECRLVNQFRVAGL
jgi:hypothetical protein